MIYEVCVMHKTWSGGDYNGSYVNDIFSRLFYKKENAESFAKDVREGNVMPWLMNPGTSLLEKRLEDENE